RSRMSKRIRRVAAERTPKRVHVLIDKLNLATECISFLDTTDKCRIMGVCKTWRHDILLSPTKATRLWAHVSLEEQSLKAYKQLQLLELLDWKCPERRFETLIIPFTLFDSDTQTLDPIVKLHVSQRRLPRVIKVTKPADSDYWKDIGEWLLFVVDIFEKEETKWDLTDIFSDKNAHNA